MSKFKTKKLSRLSEFENKYGKYKEDTIYGGKLLYSTAKEIYTEINTSSSKDKIIIDGNNLSSTQTIEEWKNLVKDIFSHYEWERRILENNLILKEFRPRTFFNTYPSEDMWTSLPNENEEINVKARYCEINKDLNDESKNPKKGQISVLVPISNGYRKTFRSLACLCYDVDSLLKDYYIKFHVCVNFSDDNSFYEVFRFASTMAFSRKIPVVIYYVDNRRTPGESGKQGKWRKTTVLNVMLKNIYEKTKNCNHPEHYIHFGDDDIYIEPYSNIILNNIEMLNKNKGLKIISATYSSDEDWGFSTISTIRKRREYMQTDKLLNIYGGCLTTKLKTFRMLLNKGVFPTFEDKSNELGEDSYLTILSNYDLLSKFNNKPKNLCKQLKGYARGEIIVRHRESTNVVSFLKRVTRDSAWARLSINTIVKREEDRTNILKAFKRLRSITFKEITKKINKSGNIRHILAQKWNYKIRNIAKDPPKFESMKELNWVTHKTQHQICKEIVQDKQIFKSLITTVTDGPFGYDLIHLMQDSFNNLAERFPEICNLLISRNPRNEETEKTIQKNPYLFHLYNISEESLAYAAQFVEAGCGISSEAHKSFETLNICNEDSKKRFPFSFASILLYAVSGNSSNEKIIVKPENDKNNEKVDFFCTVPTHSGRSFTAFLWRSKPTEIEKINNLPCELYIKYYPIIGRNKFLNDSPRRTVYLHVLGEQIIKTIDKVTNEYAKNTQRNSQSVDTKVEIVETLYPCLELATVQYASPERLEPFARLMQSLYIQESFRNKAKELSSTILSKKPLLQLASCLGDFLGNIHSVTLGIRSYIDRLYIPNCLNKEIQDEEPRHKLVKLLIDHLDKLRFYKPLSYKDCLKGSESIFKEPQNNNSFVYQEISKLLIQDGLQLKELWQELCSESEKIHKDFGAIGHLGLNASYLYIDYTNNETSVKYEGAPPIFHEDLKDKISYDSSKHELVFKGIITEEEKNKLLKSSTSSQYKKAVTKLYEEAKKIEFGKKKLIILGESFHIKKIYLAFHSDIALIDPAYETGLTIAELISIRLNINSMLRKINIASEKLSSLDLKLDDLSLHEIMEDFTHRYLNVLWQDTSNPFFPNGYNLPENFKRDLYKRASQFSAFFLIMKYQCKREYDLTREERYILIKTCVDLLHVATGFKLRFRESNTEPTETEHG
ncbi:MAG: hypothetical protein HZA47_12280 [Planctomycetes bacterium]|uniref:hypothetical protein n=1 Tax=Candidatus Wunengus sp. YC65 TaxID=3367701 RepID=UPI001DFDFBBD|nr:hypothetical protein [Planctomycetota bacterium]